MSPEDLEDILFSVQSPGQYCGGEYGTINYENEQILNMAISFPDLYTIGMSNQATKILYALANSVDGVQCQRVFAPMEDMEKILRERNTAYFTLEKATPLHQLDLLTFSLGYELGFNNLLNILELGQIPFRNCDRDECHPILIAGGPSVTNPIPYGSFVDFFYIGEGESGYPELLGRLKEMKKAGASREEMKSEIASQPYIWYEGKTEKTKIIKYAEFGREESWSSAYPVPTIETVQNHGVVEIMRGCPNKCRFCHAGVYYRPKREKEWDIIVKEIDVLVNECGYKDITLSSLSTGDYTDLNSLVDMLNQRYKDRHVSFALPSLRVNSLSLELIEKIGQVKKSGLTFAVEAAREEWQKGLNKDVSEEKIIEILREAKRRGWRQAKFYFMLGLPPSIDNNEEKEMIEYLNRIQRSTGINISVNIGTFIPKVFTPFMKGRQLEELTSLDKILFVKKNIGNNKIRIGFHSPFASLIEAVLSRGDKRAGELFFKAYKRGARLDSWDDHLDRKLWKEIIAEADWDVEAETCSNHENFKDLYDYIDLGVTEKSLEKENALAFESKLSDPCLEECSDHCGVCNRTLKVRNANRENWSGHAAEEHEPSHGYHPYLLTMSKQGRARFVGHLDFSRTVERALYRCAIPLKMSEGFNPKPKIEFANPISLGASSCDETVLIELTATVDEKDLKDKFNSKSPEGFGIEEVIKLPVIEGKKKLTLMKNWGGSDWLVRNTKRSNTDVFQKVKELIKEQELENSFKLLSEEGEDLRVRHIFSRTKVPYNSINKFLRCNFKDYANFRLTRERSMALSKEGNLVTYKDFFLN